ncbi:Response regulator PleD [Planctomycetes bacterium MalM25]|nr:Response regulator PleD [Planctomycetes bacterium MalM25]
MNVAAGATIEDRTLMDPSVYAEPEVQVQDCCLVQIYPADVIDGMLRLENGSVVVGRDTACDLHLPDASVSRKHAELRRTAEGYEVADLGSTNGTLVNGEPVTTRKLNTGDSVKFGGFLFKFLSADSIETVYHETVYSALTIDALTGAFNKSYLLDNLQREIACFRRHARPLAVVMTDIDRFKSVNDTHGHLVGDEVLREFGQRIAGARRDGDLFARYGGEEFCLLLPDTAAVEAAEVSERCRAVVADTPFDTAAGPLTVTASFGIEVLTDQADATPNDLIGAADERLYTAKEGGRNRVVGPAEG